MEQKYKEQKMIRPMNVPIIRLTVVGQQCGFSKKSWQKKQSSKSQMGRALHVTLGMFSID
jgi:hypothetical protein